MSKVHGRGVVLVVMAAVFTVGLMFATMELPYLADSFFQQVVTTPNLDSHADATSRLKTEMFIGHYHLRVIGYACFGLTVLLIIVGFVTKKSGWAAFGAVAFMLPVFAQFAGVMFFLAGLGILNVLWLPVLDISFDIPSLGLIIRAPYDLLMWGLRKFGINGYWPLVYCFIGSGLFLFFLGTFAWLSARARKRDVADFWVYRISRHPQYLGWILWSYGLYLLLMQQQYPRRSWGIDASLPWLLSTMVIIGVALLEEVKMRRQYGQVYETYRWKAPFLLPLPRPVTWLFALPFRALYRREYPQRRREVAVVISLYTVVLIGLSVLFYRGGLATARHLATSESRRESEMEEMATGIREHPNWRAKYVIADKLMANGDAAIKYFIPLLQDQDNEVSQLAARYLGKVPSETAVQPLVTALGDPNDNVRGRALQALAAIGSSEAVEPMKALLDDPVEWVRTQAARSLAELGATELTDRLLEDLHASSGWVRLAYIEALGTMGPEQAAPAIEGLLNDESENVRRAAAVALMKIGSPTSYDALTRAANNDEDWEVRMYATEALRQLEAKVGGPTE